MHTATVTTAFLTLLLQVLHDHISAPETTGCMRVLPPRYVTRVCGKIISHKPPPPAFRRHRPTSVTRQQTQPQPPRASSALPDRHHRQQISATRVHRNQFSPLGLRDLPPPALAPPRSASHRSHANAPHRRTFTPGTQDAETTKLLHIYRTSQQINPTLTPHPPIAKPCPP